MKRMEISACGALRWVVFGADFFKSADSEVVFYCAIRVSVSADGTTERENELPRRRGEPRSAQCALYNWVREVKVLGGFLGIRGIFCSKIFQWRKRARAGHGRDDSFLIASFAPLRNQRHLPRKREGGRWLDRFRGEDSRPL